MFMRKLVLPIVIIVVAYIWFSYIKRGPIYESEKSLKGKTVLITGGNAGIGKATSIELAKKGARIIIASRNKVKSEQARQEIIKDTGNDNVHVMRLDLADFDSVRSFVKEFDASEEHLDYLINNAGTMDLNGMINSGINKIFAINHFGHFLLTNLLLEKMKAQSSSRPVRIINVSSEGYKIGIINSDVFYESPTTIYDMFKMYCNTKLANVYFTSELQRRIKDYDITTYSLHPGFIETDIGQQLNGPILVQYLANWILLPLFARSTYYGSQTILYCALDDDVEILSGSYFSNCAHNELESVATNEMLQTFLWSKSVNVTGLSQP